MHESIEKIYYAFDGKLVGTFTMRVHVCETLSKMPAYVIDLITEKCWFLGSMDEAWAYAFTGNDLKDMHLIFLSDALFSQDINQIEFTIAHEIGHIVLEHRNSTLVKQTKKEIKLQEEQADAFAREFVSKSIL